ncbi:MAG: DUF2950 domain-containing protein [Planctomycetota bacterium]|nr:DUF2950 domain-containing protein [Planctomycetota bacterium]
MTHIEPPPSDEEPELSIQPAGGEPLGPAAEEAAANVPQMAPVPGEFKRAVPWVKFGVAGGLVLLLAVAALIAYPYLMRETKGEVDAMELAAAAPANCVAVAALAQPERTVKAAVKSLDESLENMPPWSERWQAAREAFRSELGFGLEQTDRYADAGIDLTQPVTFALLPLDESHFPTGAVASVAVSTYQKGYEFFKGLAKAADASVKEDKSAEPAVYLAGNLAMAIEDGRMHVYAAPDAVAAKDLRGFLAKRAQQNLAAGSAFAETLKGLGTVEETTLYVNLEPLKKAAGSGAFADAMKDVVGLAFSAGESKNVLHVQFKPNAPALSDFKAGGNCKDFVKKLGPAPFLLTWSLANPVQSLQNLMGKAGDANSFKSFDKEVAGLLGMSLSQLSKALSGGAGGVAVFPAEGSPVPGVLAFAKLSDSKQLTAALAKQYGKQEGVEAKKFEKDTLYAIPAPFARMLVGVRGDFLVLALATPEVESALACKGAADAPLGGGELLGLYMDPAPFMDTYASYVPEERQKELKAARARAEPGGFTLARKENALRLSLLIKGGDPAAKALGEIVRASLLASSLDLSSLSLPSLSSGPAGVETPGRDVPKPLDTGGVNLTGEETNALNACKAFLDAQDAYHKQDYDGDGVFEFALGLRGDGSLYENKDGEGDLKLIDSEFAGAERNRRRAGFQKAKPWQGYYFKVLDGQGPRAEGGEKSYYENNDPKKKDANLTEGVGLLCFPAAYGKDARYSFMVTHLKKVYYADLGKTTSKSGDNLYTFDPEPDKGWKLLTSLAGGE